MSQDDESDDKIYEPTQRKLDEARKKGDIPKSQDINVAASYLGLIVALTAVGAGAAETFSGTMARILGQAESLSWHIFDDGNPAPVSGNFIASTAGALAPVLLLPGLAVLLGLIAQRGIVVAPSKLEPKLNRISLIHNAKNKFGRSGLFEFFKSFVKLLIYSVVLAFFLSNKLEEMVLAMYGSPMQVPIMLAEIIIQFMLLSLVVATSIGAVDFMFQKSEYIRRNRMSHKELTDETKQSEGDPHMKNKRRQKAQELAQSRMMESVPNADVVVVNPEHYAVALAWSREKGSAPECVAKGVDEIAFAIRRVADEHGVPIHRDPPTARGLYATVEIGQEISPDHYQAVAAAIRFAEAIRAKAKARGVDTRIRGKR